MHPREPAKDLLPVLVEGLGRSGTTLAMQLLGTSDRIAFERDPPCEHRYLLYLVRMCELLEREPRSDPEWTAQHLIWDMDARVGAPPWQGRDLLRPPPSGESFAVAALRAMWSRFSAFAARNTNPRDPWAVDLYAEKAEHWLVDFLWHLGPFRVIRLVRDPRDIWQSILAFDTRRGSRGFASAQASEAEYFEQFLEQSHRHLLRAAGTIDGGACLVVTYEDMVLDLPQIARRIGDWLGCSLDADAVLAARPALRDHMTSRSPRESIGRWREEMASGTIARFMERSGQLLRQLGYV